MANLVGQSGDIHVPAVKAEHTNNGTAIEAYTSNLAAAVIIAKGGGFYGILASSPNCGVSGDGSIGVYGSTKGNDVQYHSGVYGQSEGNAPGVKGESQGGDAVIGISSSSAHAGVSAVNDSGGFGVWARGTPAGHF